MGCGLGGSDGTSPRVMVYWLAVEHRQLCYFIVDVRGGGEVGTAKVLNHSG